MNSSFPGELGRLIVMLSRARRRYLFEHLRGFGISGPMHIILIGARLFPGSSQEFLSDHFTMDKATVARCARRLEELGYLRRDVVPEDRRHYQLYLTPSGEEIVEAIQQHSESWSRKILAGFSDEDSQATHDLLTRMVAASSDLQASE